ncbi:patellin-4-like [Mangifera indica]|uniref:patellin-4-like n=1 Tax=Mangifera indica TaxID=29780 RepID=UPI001CFAE8C7|nr:patellin-4-like [Mangifera indica]
MEKSASYREESNFTSDLKEFERKALVELKKKLEEAILGDNIFKKGEVKKIDNLQKKEKEKEVVELIKETKQETKEKEEEKKPGAEEEKKVEEKKPGAEEEKKVVETKPEAGEEKKVEEKKPEAEEEKKAVEKKAEDDEEKKVVETKPEAAEEKKVEEKKPEAEEEKKVEEEDPEAEEEKTVEEKCVDKDISLWGVPLLQSKGAEELDVVLLKFLRARDFKVNDAFEMLKKSLQWRKENNIDSIMEEDVGAHLGSAAYMNGVDREGHPICYNIYGVFNDEELYQKTLATEEKRNEFLRWRLRLMEKGIQKLDLKPGGISSLLQINDLKNSPGPAKKELRIALKQAVGILQDNYPEFVTKNLFINAPFWYYALNAVLSPFLTQRTKSKFVVSRPAKVTETLLKYISPEELPVQYGGFKREDDFEFANEESKISEITVKPGSTESIEITADEIGTTITWDVCVIGWEVNYREEFVPSDEGSYTIIVQKGKKISTQEAPIRNTFRNNEPGKVMLTVENPSSKKKRLFYRYKTNKSSCL